MSRYLKKIQPADESGLHVWLILWKAYMAVREFAVRDVESQGLSLTDFGILEAVFHKGPLAVNDIGAKISLTSGSMTVAIQRLEKRGLVERRGHAGDKRTRMVHLTAAGRKLIRCAFGAHEQTMNQLGETLSAGERKEAIRLLKKLGRAAATQLAEG